MPHTTCAYIFHRGVVGVLFHCILIGYDCAAAVALVIYYHAGARLSERQVE